MYFRKLAIVLGLAAVFPVAQCLKDESGRDVQGEKAVEVIFQQGKLVKAVDQFGIGQVMTSSTTSGR